LPSDTRGLLKFRRAAALPKRELTFPTLTCRSDFLEAAIA
jgi:hypothetical protein